MTPDVDACICLGRLTDLAGRKSTHGPRACSGATSSGLWRWMDALGMVDSKGYAVSEDPNATPPKTTFPETAPAVAAIEKSVIDGAIARLEAHTSGLPVALRHNGEIAPWRKVAMENCVHKAMDHNKRCTICRADLSRCAQVPAGTVEGIAKALAFYNAEMAKREDRKWMRLQRLAERLGLAPVQ